MMNFRLRTINFFLYSFLSVLLAIALSHAQQPQTASPNPQALQGTNSKWANGVGPGYWPYQSTGGALGTCTGLNLCIGPGTAPQCMGSSHVTYAGTSSFALTNNATNYVYLDLDNSCVPAVNTVGYSNRNIAIAKVVTSGGAVTSLSDDRFWGSSQVVLGQVNAQTGASYTVISSDRNKLVTLSNASPVAVTLPTTLGATFTVVTQNLGVGTATLTPSSGTINGAANLVLATGSGAWLFFDGTNWQAMLGSTGGGTSTTAFTASYLNDTIVGTTNFVPAKWKTYGINQQHITKTDATDTGIGWRTNLVGIVQSGGGTSGSAVVVYAGRATCQFDNAATIGDFVQIGATGLCSADPTAGVNENPEIHKYFAKVHTTIGAAGNTDVDLLPVGAFDAPSTPMQVPLITPGSPFVHNSPYYYMTSNPGGLSVGSNASPVMSGPGQRFAWAGSDFVDIYGAANNADGFNNLLVDFSDILPGFNHAFMPICQAGCTVGSGAATYAASMYTPPFKENNWSGGGGPGTYNTSDLAADNWYFVLVHNTAINLSSLAPGHHTTWTVDNTGGFTWAWPSQYVNAPTVSAGSIVTAEFWNTDTTHAYCVAGCSGSGGTPSGPAGGDLGGTYPNPTVVQVNGGVIPTSAPVIGTNGSKQLVAASGHNVVTPLNCNDTSGSGTAQSCSTSPTFTPAAKDCVVYNTTTANTGALTLNVNSSSAAPVQKWLGTALVSGDIPANHPQPVCYDGTNWQVSTIGNVPSSGGGGQAGATLFSTTGSTTATAASATSLIGSVTGSTTVAANTWAAGGVTEIMAEGYYTDPLTPRSLTIDLKIGGTTRITTGAVALIANVSNGVWRFRCAMTTRTAGVSGTQIANCIFETTGSTLTPGEAPLQTSSTWTIDTTAGKAIDIQATWDATTGSPSITSTNVAAWIPGAPVNSVNGDTGTVTVHTLFDSNGNKTVDSGATASAVDYVKVTNDATGSPATVKVEAVGTDSNVNLNLVSKGTGTVQCNGASCGGGSSGLVLVEQHTASSSATLNFTTCITSTYDEYDIEVTNLVPATNAVSLNMRFSTNGGSTYDATSGHYGWSGWIVGATGGSAITGSNSATFIRITPAMAQSNTASTGGVTLSLKLHGPGNGVVNPRVEEFGSGFDGTNEASYFGGGRYIQTTAVNAFQVVEDSGNIASGIVRCYGMAK